jgi:hypothetical protein
MTGAQGIGGKRLFEASGRDTRGIVSDFIRALNEATEVMPITGKLVYLYCANKV